MIRRAALLLALVAATAQAAERPDRGNGMFFNRPGADATALRTDLGQCRAIAEGQDSQINGVSVLAGGIGALIGGALAGKRQTRINVENCMLIRGWRLYALTSNEGAAWSKGTQAERDARLDALAGVERPDVGTLLRAWHNDYAEPAYWPKDAK